jgi:hypothetical protein
MTERNGPKCGAKRHGRAETCTLPAGWGTDHVGTGRCRKHFGNAPNVARAAAREIVLDQAKRVLADLVAPPVTNPFAALRRLGGFAEAWRATCAYLVNKIGEDDLRYAGQVGGLHAEQLCAEISMLQDAMRTSASILTAWRNWTLSRHGWRLSRRKRRCSPPRSRQRW